MSESLITKKALAASIKELMGTIPLAKISIRKIVDNCGINRQTFYYHFKDKFDLVNWIYKTEAIETISDCKNYDKWIDGTYKTLVYFKNNRLFYNNALNESGQNAFYEYFFQATYELIVGVVKHISYEINVSDKDINFISNFYTHAIVGVTVQWIKENMNESPKIMVDKINGIVEGSVILALKRYQRSRETEKQLPESK